MSSVLSSPSRPQYVICEARRALFVSRLGRQKVWMLRDHCHVPVGCGASTHACPLSHTVAVMMPYAKSLLAICDSKSYNEQALQAYEMSRSIRLL